MTTGKKVGQNTGQKFALLIGVSEFGDGFKPLHTPGNAIAQFKAILTDPAIGGFPVDHVTDLLNPTVGEVQEKIGDFFGNCHQNDVRLLYFVGHGVKNETGDFYFTTCQTRKFNNGTLNTGTAVAASFVLGEMGRSRSRRQVVILDCCFSGAFPDGVLAMDDGRVDIEHQLGGEGRAVLTAATSTQYALEQEGEDLSVYTRYFLEGLKTGAAAPDDQQWIEVGHLHEYVRQKLETAAASMSPQIYAARDGCSIILANAPVGDPNLRYRKRVQRYLRELGQISPVGRRLLKRNGQKWGLSAEEMQAIEEEVCRPYVERQENLAEYEAAYREALEYENPPSERLEGELRDYQKELNLRDEDVEDIHSKFSDMLLTAGDVAAIASARNNDEVIASEDLNNDATTDRSPAHGGSFVEDLEDGITIEMVRIPGGSSMMGSPEGEGRDSERPQHQVTMPSFYMGKYVVTQRVYEVVTRKNPSNFKGSNRPVEEVSWHDAIAFCQKLSERTGRSYRLPSEAEWEYACRAGTTTAYAFGDAIAPELANYGRKVGETSDVGNYPSNAFGLYDMHGNAWEWCADHWHENYDGAPGDNSAWISGGNNKYRVVRGGSWFYGSPDCRSAYRYGIAPGDRYHTLGFRLVCSAP